MNDNLHWLSVSGFGILRTAQHIQHPILKSIVRIHFSNRTSLSRAVFRCNQTKADQKMKTNTTRMKSRNFQSSFVRHRWRPGSVTGSSTYNTPQTRGSMDTAGEIWIGKWGKAQTREPVKRAVCNRKRILLPTHTLTHSTGAPRRCWPNNTLVCAVCMPQT